MKCAYHPEVDAVAACVNCGNLVCAGCRTVLREKSYCEACVNKLYAARTIAASRTAKPLIGGILGILSGAWGMFISSAFVWIGLAGVAEFDNRHIFPVAARPQADQFFIVAGVVLFLLSMVAITGSSFAIARRHFGLALAGGICAVLSGWLVGIPALILIVLSRSEFPSSRKKEAVR